MLALPYIMSRCGIAVFIVLMLLMAMVVDYSLWLLLSSAKSSKTKSYEDLCEAVRRPSCTAHVYVCVCRHSGTGGGLWYVWPLWYKTLVP